MATKMQVTAAKRNVRKAQAGAKQKRSIANMPAKTRQELYDIAKRKNLPGRSKMGRDELAKALGYK
jgi:hypothetical protein